MNTDRPQRATEAFFGRRRGKTLRTGQSQALERCLKLLSIDLGEDAPSDVRSLFGTAVSDIHLEIGFGGGEHLLSRMTSNPQTGFIGVEPFVNGMAKLASSIATDPPKNLRLYDDDAVRLLDWLPTVTIAGVDLLYPDPWPKKKHWKRRFVSRANLDRFAKVMKPGAELRFASDIDTYVNWTLLHFSAHPAFEWLATQATDWKEPFAGWPGTRYEAKALRQGRQPAYLRFKRI